MNVYTGEQPQLRVERRRDVNVKKSSTVFAITTWSALPVIAAVEAIFKKAWLVAAIPGTIAVVALAAAALVWRSTERHQVVAAVLLLLISTPFAALLFQGLVLEPLSHALAIADSPPGYIIGIIGDALWKRRAGDPSS